MKDLKDYIISLDSSIKQLIFKLESNASQIVLVVKDERLQGTVTDGDIRRALLRGETLNSSVEKIMNKNFKFLPETASEIEAFSLMKKETLKQMPLLDKEGRLKKIFLLDELIKPKFLPNDVVIMAGGKGKRLGVLTEDCPKPMLKINNRPILEIILEQCIEAGLKNFYFSVNYLKEQIQNYFEDGSRWNICISYLEENKSLGTAGSLSLFPHQPKEPILVLNGDVLTKVDYNHLIQFHKEHVADISLCVREHSTKIPYGIVSMKDLHVLALEEKPILTHFINAGIYVLEPSVLNLVSKDTYFDMPQLIKLAKEKKYKINAFPIHEYWQDLGYPETLLQTAKVWK